LEQKRNGGGALPKSPRNPLSLGLFAAVFSMVPAGGFAASQASSEMSASTRAALAKAEEKIKLFEEYYKKEYVGFTPSDGDMEAKLQALKNYAEKVKENPGEYKRSSPGSSQSVAQAAAARQPAAASEAPRQVQQEASARPPEGNASAAPGEVSEEAVICDLSSLGPLEYERCFQRQQAALRACIETKTNTDSYCMATIMDGKRINLDELRPRCEELLAKANAEVAAAKSDPFTNVSGNIYKLTHGDAGKINEDGEKCNYVSQSGGTSYSRAIINVGNDYLNEVKALSDRIESKSATISVAKDEAHCCGMGTLLRHMITKAPKTTYCPGTAIVNFAKEQPTVGYITSITNCGRIIKCEDTRLFRAYEIVTGQNCLAQDLSNYSPSSPANTTSPATAPKAETSASPLETAKKTTADQGESMIKSAYKITPGFDYNKADCKQPNPGYNVFNCYLVDNTDTYGVECNTIMIDTSGKFTGNAKCSAGKLKKGDSTDTTDKKPPKAPASSPSASSVAPPCNVADPSADKVTLALVSQENFIRDGQVPKGTKCCSPDGKFRYNNVVMECKNGVKQ